MLKGIVQMVSLRSFPRFRRRSIRQLLSLRGASQSNKVQLYFDGSQAFRAMWKAIDSAKNRVWIETFILKTDVVGRRTLEKLENAAKRGCHVILIYDHLGSLSIRDRDVSDLTMYGGKVIVFHPIFGFPYFWPLYRTHRKILIVDSNIGFCGGMNISGDYAGPEVGGNGRFRDTHCQLNGPCVKDLENVFIRSLKSANRATWRQVRKLMIPEGENDSVPVGDKLVQVLDSDALQNKRNIQKSITHMLSGAKSNCHITTPYFLPPLKLRNALLKSKERGVDIKIITQGVSDVPLIGRASNHIFGLFLRSGIKIFRMVDRELHAKTMTVDGVYCTVGSFNLDDLSYYHMLEVKVTILDSNITQQMDVQFLSDLKGCQELSLETWKNRSLLNMLVDWLAYHLCRIVCFI